MKTNYKKAKSRNNTDLIAMETKVDLKTWGNEKIGADERLTHMDRQNPGRECETLLYEG